LPDYRLGKRRTTPQQTVFGGQLRKSDFLNSFKAKPTASKILKAGLLFRITISDEDFWPTLGSSGTAFHFDFLCLCLPRLGVSKKERLAMARRSW
jgi:hypothetical protein